jgi:hypothetical protein
VTNSLVKKILFATATLESVIVESPVTLTIPSVEAELPVLTLVAEKGLVFPETTVLLMVISATQNPAKRT